VLFVCTGPESSGKTTLSNYLCSKFNLAKVDEYARSHLQQGTRYLPIYLPNYLPSDLLEIAQCQHAVEMVAVRFANNGVVADTDLQTVYLWWQEKFGPAPSALQAAYAVQTPRIYLLCKPDIPWVADPLRENSDDRDRLFEIYEEDLRKRHLSYEVIEGSEHERLGKVREVVSKYLSTN
jgi:nicotinamide riboside kinase